MIRCLFIGGPLDGQTEWVRDDAFEVVKRRNEPELIHVDQPDTSPTFEVVNETYRRVNTHPKTRPAIYVHSSVSQNDWPQLLVDGYKRPDGKKELEEAKNRLDDAEAVLLEVLHLIWPLSPNLSAYLRKYEGKIDYNKRRRIKLP